jgi:glycerate dehydrogenase
MAPPRIVILDGYTLNPGDLSWEPLAALGAVTGFDRTAPADIVARARGADIVLTNKTPLSADTLAQLAGLRYIGVLATGYNAVDGAAARARGIPVTNIPEYGTRAVAEHALALLLELARHVGDHAASVRAGRWAASVDWCYWDHPMIELAGRRLGIIGPGRIGQAFAGLGAALGMSVEFARRSGGPPELARVLAQSDVVSLHCPLTAETRGLIRAETLALMKPTALLINTSRGGLINEADLAAALNTERLAGAGLDVLSVEPPAKDNPLLSAKHCLITPHNAWGAQDTRARLMDRAAANLRAFLAGHPIHVVN